MKVAVLSLTRDRGDYTTSATKERFWGKVDRRTDDQCWPWTASLNTNGYGQFNCPSRRRPIPASRFCLEMVLGRDLRPGMFALHTCDNRLCVNPAHLYEGTASENTRDALARGRHGCGRGQNLNIGSANGNSKLTEADVVAIRASKESPVDLARRFGVSRDTIRLIRTRRTWGHV